MLLNKSEGAEKEMPEDENNTDQVGQKSRPETAVNIGENTYCDQGQTYI